MKKYVLFVVLTLGIGLAGPALAANKLFVGNLPYATTSADVASLVGGFGPVLAIVVRGVDRDGRMSARAEVVFENEADVDVAVARLDGAIVGGEPIHASKKVREIVVVGSKVKEVIREAGLRPGNGLIDALNDKVHALLRQAIRRAKADGRSTVRPHDL